MKLIRLIGGLSYLSDLHGLVCDNAMSFEVSIHLVRDMFVLS